MASAALPAIDPQLVQALLTEQHRDLARLPISEFADGWDNRIFRLGAELTVRMPRRVEGAQLMANEQRWMPGLIAGISDGPDPLATSAPIRLGEPGCGYPWHWTVGPWLPGQNAAVAPIADPHDAARRLGAFLGAFHRPAPPEAPHNPYRGGPLASRDAFLELHLAVSVDQGRSLGDGVTPQAIVRRWAHLSGAAAWDGPPLWLHGDPHPLNLLVHEGRLSAIIDFGDLTLGDPATDLLVAWQLLPAAARATFREAASAGDYEVDDAMWTRGEGWALAHCVAVIAGAEDPDQPLAGVCRRTLAELVLR
ncbi:MAG: putative phosphotransferase [Pseudonocardiales bacterium]|nr:putative phosphotransferase [Pseudonocardiales bacterium]